MEGISVIFSAMMVTELMEMGVLKPVKLNKDLTVQLRTELPSACMWVVYKLYLLLASKTHSVIIC